MSILIQLLETKRQQDLFEQSVLLVCSDISRYTQLRTGLVEVKIVDGLKFATYTMLKATGLPDLEHHVFTEDASMLYGRSRVKYEEA